jgi:hypothetical protein
MKWFMCIFMLVTLACNSEVTITEDEIGAGVFYAKDSYCAYSGSIKTEYCTANHWPGTKTGKCAEEVTIAKA